jgi:hypothetical protein
MDGLNAPENILVNHGGSSFVVPVEGAHKPLCLKEENNG